MENVSGLLLISFNLYIAQTTYVLCTVCANGSEK